jgi:hypothetical protein
MESSDELTWNFSLWVFPWHNFSSLEAFHVNDVDSTLWKILDVTSNDMKSRSTSAFDMNENLFLFCHFSSGKRVDSPYWTIDVNCRLCRALCWGFPEPLNNFFLNKCFGERRVFCVTMLCYHGRPGTVGQRTVDVFRWKDSLRGRDSRLTEIDWLTFVAEQSGADSGRAEVTKTKWIYRKVIERFNPTQTAKIIPKYPPPQSGSP